MGYSVIVSSGKGGVGKTTAVTNIGVALADLGKKVAIVDGSLTTPDVSLHLGIPLSALSLAHVLKGHAGVDAALFSHKSGLTVLPGHVHMEVLREFEGKKFAKVLDALKKRYDIVLVDSAAGLGREAVSAIKHCDRIITVVNPELTSVVHASKTLQIAKDLKVKPAGVILNRVGRHSQELTEEEMTQLLHKVPVIASIPEDARVSLAIKNSEVVVSHFPNCRASQEFKNVAFALSGKRKKQASDSMFRRILQGMGFYRS
jgi:septum site-determining protein MinD